MIFAVSAVFDIIHVVSSLLTEQSRPLCACHVETLLTTGSVASHAGSGSGLGLAALLLTEVASLKEEKKWREKNYYLENP